MEANQAVESVNKEMTKAYLAGMLDTSATMIARINKAKDYQLGYTIEPEIAVSRKQPFGIQRMDDFCAKNGVYCTVNKRGDRFELSITRPRDVLRFLELIAPYLQDRREEAEMLREEIVPAIQEGRHLSDKNGFVSVVSMIDELRELNPRNADSDYTAEYFREEWNL